MATFGTITLKFGAKGQAGEAPLRFQTGHINLLVASCVSSGVNVNIIRLTYDDENATARKLDASALRQLALDPLLRSESTLSALFHHGAVVTESAADRLVYDEVNTRLLADGKADGGVESCAFLNAQNWQTVPRMIKPLREMGVAAAAVVDADVLFGKEFPTILGDNKGSLKGGDRGESKGGLKGDVIAGLDESEREVFEHLRRDLADYGVFIVPCQPLRSPSARAAQPARRGPCDPRTPRTRAPDSAGSPLGCPCRPAPGDRASRKGNGSSPRAAESSLGSSPRSVPNDRHHTVFERLAEPLDARAQKLG